MAVMVVARLHGTLAALAAQNAVWARMRRPAGALMRRAVLFTDSTLDTVHTICAMPHSGCDILGSTYHLGLTDSAFLVLEVAMQIVHDHCCTGEHISCKDYQHRHSIQTRQQSRFQDRSGHCQGQQYGLCNCQLATPLQACNWQRLRSCASLRRSRPWSVGPISSEARLDAIDAGLRVLQADIEAAFLSDALDHLGEAAQEGDLCAFWQACDVDSCGRP